MPSRCILLFVDGLGIPGTDDTGLLPAQCPTLDTLLRDACVPLDAQLGVPGLPQSASGQTAIFTGVNAPAVAGGHKEGFPDAQLRQIIAADNLFQRLLDVGKRCLFANAYVRLPGEQLPTAFRSVTTVMTLAALGTTLTREELRRGRAVFHDLTRESLGEHGITDIPIINEATAAQDLLNTARTVDFCLFEFFLTDRAGHRGTAVDCSMILQRLDRFVAALLKGLAHDSELLLLVSDHGNIESQTTRHHTTNPVPWIAVGCGAEQARAGMTSLLDVTPRILQVLTSTAPGEPG